MDNRVHAILEEPDYREALDIFLLLNRNNDGFLKYEETEELRDVIFSLPHAADRGKIDSEDRFREIFYQANQMTVDFQAFKKMLDRAEINVAAASEALYDRQYTGCFNLFCCKCLKCCCKRIRRSMVQGKLKQLDEDQRVKKRKYADMFTIVKQVQASVVEGLDLFTDIVLLNQIYWEGVKPENKDKDSFKIAVLLQFISICSCFLIAYSSIVNMLLYNGVYEPAQIRRQGYVMVFFRLLFLSFVGPIYFVFIELLHKIMNVASFFGLLCGKQGHSSVKNFFLALIKQVFGLHQEQCEGLETQRGIVQLCFESLPMLILQVLIRYKVLDLGPMFDSDNENSSNALFFSLLTTLATVIFVLFNVRIESKAFDEDLLEYTLNCFRARQQWIPFIHQIRQQELKQAINYSELYCEYPNLTGKSGAYKLFIYRFTDISLQKLTSELVKWDNRASETIKNELEYLHSDDENMEGGEEENRQQNAEVQRERYVMDLGGSVEFCTINMLLHFYNLAPKNKINIKLTGIGWDVLLKNSLALNLIKRDRQKGGKFQATTQSGQHLLWVCVDDEKLSKHVLVSTDIHKKLLKVTYNYSLVQAYFEKDKREIEQLPEGEGRTRRQASHDDLLQKGDIQLSNYEELENIREDFELLVQLRQHRNADMQYISYLMLSISLRLKNLGIKTKNAQKFIAAAHSSMLPIVKRCQELKIDEGAAAQFREIMANYPNIPRLDLVESFENLAVPKFFNPNSWVLEECFKMLIQQDTNLLFKDFDGCDMDIKDNFDETLLIHTVKTCKNRSLELMLKRGADLELANDKGITPVGQTIISRNAEALELLLKHGADIHRNCVVDLSVSNKVMKPLHYLAKLVRLHGVNKEIKSLIDVLKNNNVEITDEEEKIGVQRQMCRLASSQNFRKADVQRALKDLKIASEYDLLEFRDRKNNNFTHLALKGLSKDAYFDKHQLISILNTFGVKANGESYNYEFNQIKQRLSMLISEDNNEGKSALGEAFANGRRPTVNSLVSAFIEKFDAKQERQAIRYIYNAAGTSFGFFTRERFRDYWSPITGYFNNWEEIQKTVVKIARQDLFKNEYCWPNLVQDGFVPNERPRERHRDFYGGGPRRQENFEREQIVTPTYYDDKPVGQYMRKQPEDIGPSVNQQIQEEPDQIQEGQIIKQNNEAAAEDNEEPDKQVGNDNLADIRKNKQRGCAILNLELLEEDVKTKKEKKANKHFEFLFNIIIELIALFDMVGDLYALVLVYRYGYTAWFTVSIFTIISPFYVCYVPLLTFQKERAEQNENETTFQRFLAFLSLTPLILIDLLFMDLVYIFNSVIVTPLVFLFTCGRLDTQAMENRIDKIYNYLFGMTEMDIKGFRRLRTISQLTFESFPQIILQSSILLTSIGEDKELGVDMEAILISLGSAVVHSIFELIFLHLEALSCKTTKIHYTIVCFNARFGWIPFIHFFSSVSGFDHDDQAQKQNSSNKMDMDLNYEGMRSKLCAIIFRMNFKFSDPTCRVLTNSLSNLLIEKIPEKRYNLKLGESLNDVSFDSILSLVQMAYMRVNLDISEVNLKAIINSPNNQKVLDELRNPDKEPKTKENYMIIQQVVQLSQGDILQAMLDVEGIDIDVKPTLFEIAEKNDDFEMMKILINHRIQNQLRDYISELNKVNDCRCQFREWIKYKNVKFLCAIMTSPRLIVTEQFQYYFIKRLLEELNKNNLETAGFLMSFVFGSDLPYHLIRGDGRDASMRDEDSYKVEAQIQKFHNFFRGHKQKLKDQVHFYSHDSSAGHVNIVLPTTVVSCFAVLREHIISHWPLDHVAFNEQMIGGKYKPFDLKATTDLGLLAFKRVCLLISEQHAQVESLTPRQIYDCDQVVEELKLDKHRARYFARSRSNDGTYQYYDLLVTELPQLSLDIRNEVYQQGFRQRVVIADNRSQFHGMTCRGFDYTLPEDVMAVKYFEIYYEFFGGSINMTHLSPTHQSFAGISLHDDNKWYTETYKEELEDDDPVQRAHSKGGYKDIIANAKGGDTIQLWIETNGYAFVKNVTAKFTVIKKMSLDDAERLERCAKQAALQDSRIDANQQNSEQQIIEEAHNK